MSKGLQDRVYLQYNSEEVIREEIKQEDISINISEVGL